MAKLTGEIVYGIENKEKLKRIIDALSIKPVKWDDLSLDFFDEINEADDDWLEGHTDKHFYRANVNQMSNLIDEIQNNSKCSYVTPINGVVKENLIPEKVSTLIKYQSDFRAVSEVLASQILNLFGVATCYNFFVGTDNKYDTYVGSVDMISGNQRFYTLCDLWIGLYMCIDNLLEDEYFFESLKNSSKVKKDYGIDLKYDPQKIREELILTYLVRECLLTDGDFTAANCGFLVDTVTGECQFVNFDFEMTLMSVSADAMRGVVNRTLEYVYDNAPEIYDKFIKQVEELNKVVIEIEIDYFDDNHRYAIEQLKTNIKKILLFDMSMRKTFKDSVKE